jgi:chorismate synthase
VGNTFGKVFAVTTFGESHGGAVGAVIDGCPPGFKIDVQLVQEFLNRRRPGQSKLTSPRDEKDQVTILSGLEDGITLGTPIMLMCHNENVRQGDYKDIAKIFRPSHADYTTLQKYGIAASSGGGRSSARETIGRVAAAAVAEQILQKLIKGFEVVGFVDRVKDIQIDTESFLSVTRAQVEKNALRCPDPKKFKDMEKLILSAKDQGDSVGGAVCCVIKNCPTGLGAPVFDKLEADLAKAMLSLPASKGFEIGSGFGGTYMYGSEHNDEYVKVKSQVRTKTNRSGGIQGGMSNGEPITMRVGFKPVATIFKNQKTLTKSGAAANYKPEKGRHDPCVLPRAVPMVEAMALLTVMDHFLRQRLIESFHKK